MEDFTRIKTKSSWSKSLLSQSNFQTIFFVLCISISILSPLTTAEIQQGENGLPEVDTLNGRIQGRWLKARNGRTYAAFEGIEYAHFAGRFRAPEPPSNWTGLKVTNTSGAICPQFEVVNAVFQDSEERCLFANVYVPMSGTKPVANLTTMVWIHGGGFIFGAGSFLGGHYFMSEDVLLVTFNYRLGNFGFLHTGDGDGAATGNFGFKDMVMALKWVQGNKGHFANETGTTTIFGESAGSAAVHALVLSPAAKGLFDKAVMQSGTMFCPWSLQQTPQENSKALGRELNCTVANTSQMVECLRTKTIRQLLDAETAISARGNFSVYSFGPTVDGKTKTEGVDYPVFPDSPLNLIEKGGNSSSIHLPMIIGTNEKEGLMNSLSLLLDKTLTLDLNTNWDDIMTEVLLLKNRPDKNKTTQAIVRQVRQFYMGNSSISNATEANLTNLYSDFFFYSGIRRAAQLHAKAGAKVFPYILTYPGKFSLVNFLYLPTQGVSHADDLQYFFDSTQMPYQNWPPLNDTKDINFSVNIVRTWAHFSRTGVPELWGSSKWPVLTPSINENSSSLTPMTWLELKETPSNWIETTSVLSRTGFWQTVFSTGEDDDSGGNAVQGLNVWLLFLSIISIFYVKYYSDA